MRVDASVDDVSALFSVVAIHYPKAYGDDDRGNEQEKQRHHGKTKENGKVKQNKTGIQNIEDIKGLDCVDCGIASVCDDGGQHQRGSDELTGGTRSSRKCITSCAGRWGNTIIHNHLSILFGFAEPVFSIAYPAVFCKENGCLAGGLTK